MASSEGLRAQFAELLEANNKQIFAKLQELVAVEKAQLERDPIVRELRGLHKAGVVTQEELAKHEAQLHEFVQRQTDGLSHQARVEELLDRRTAGLASESRVRELIEEVKPSANMEQRLEEVLVRLQQMTDHFKDVVAKEARIQLEELLDGRAAGSLAAAPAGAVTEARVRELLEQHVDARTAGLLTEDQGRELIRWHMVCGPQSPSRPGTSPGPFAATQARSRAQHKAAWPSSAYTAVAAVPDGPAFAFAAQPAAEQQAALTHQGLEQGLVERALVALPDHRGLGFSEVVVRDMVNVVVRDIVGIFESLLDRLLIEKKHDTIRTMVAELVTEDIAATIATGRQQLKKQELGHIVMEIERLRTEMRENEESWEEKFRLTRELRDSQDDLWAAVDARCKDLESRLGVVQHEYVHRSALDLRFQEVKSDLTSASTCAANTEAAVKALGERATGFEAFCRDTFATVVLVDGKEDALTKAVAACRSSTERGLAELRDACATEARVAHLQAAQDERFQQLTSQLHDTKKDIMTDLASASTCAANNEAALKALGERVEHFQAFCKDTFATNVSVDGKEDGLTKAITACRSFAERSLTELRDACATAADVQAAHEEKLQQLASQVHDTKDRCENVLATREYALQVATSECTRVAAGVDAKQDVVQLRLEFEEERERLRLSARQQQTTRKDLQEAQELLHDVKTRCADLQKQYLLMGERVHGLDSREAEHWQKHASECADMRQNHADLSTVCQSMRDELRSHIDYQKSEAEKLRHHSTQRYLEQIDKALALHQNLDKLEMGHRELKETVVKLPRVI